MHWLATNIVLCFLNSISEWQSKINDVGEKQTPLNEVTNMWRLTTGAFVWWKIQSKKIQFDILKCWFPWKECWLLEREGKNLSFIWLTLPASDGKNELSEGVKEGERERERERSFRQHNHLVQRSPSNHTLHLYRAETGLDSILRSIWFRREGTWLPISGPLVVNVYHLPATGTYARRGSVFSSLGVRHKQLMVGRW